MTSVKPWPCGRFVEGDPAVLHTVGAECSVFPKTAYSCSVIFRFVIQLQPNGLFFMQNPRVTSIILATVDFQFWKRRKCILDTQNGSWGVCWSIGSGSESVREPLSDFGVPKTKPQGGSKSIWLGPVLCSEAFSFFHSFSRFPKKGLTRISEVRFDSAGSIVDAFSCFFS